MKSPCIPITDDDPRRAECSEILHEIDALCTMHEKISQASECREFNRRAALLLQRLEDAGWNRLADRAMDILASCNPKDLSQCDSIQQARASLQRLKELAKLGLENESD
ncbi:MAG: hypothetical protein A4E44_02353 [Methanosaeta sp. PtaB.Bin018]|nr:hypothetical protein [Methanothrix sp.]OPX73846.1 MAG: hypothetical protein A4E44_02353 [Methanosaeta sp. PtaB.Bin018]OPY47120.1 MAG: hypothetical protein A4E46_00614 [Methanosaeta sp. PtaU1.Bin016]